MVNPLQVLLDAQQRIRALPSPVRQALGLDAPDLPGPLNTLPAPVRQGLGVVSPLLPGGPVGAAVGSALAPLGLANAQAVAQRAGQEWQSSDRDTLPNPLLALLQARGINAPATLHYNPLSNVPVVGGLINRTVNAPLHALGLGNEVAQAATHAGYGALVGLGGAETARYYDNHPNETPDASAREMLGAWQALQRGDPGAAADAEARVNPLAALVSEALLNPLNYAGGVGQAGQALEVAGQAPALARALKGVGLAGEALNRAPMLPLALLPRARAALLDLPAWAKPAEEAATSPALARALAGLHDRPALDPNAPLPPPVQIPLRADTAPAPPAVQIPLRLGAGGTSAPPLTPFSPPARGGAALNPLLVATEQSANQQAALRLAVGQGGTPSAAALQRELGVGMTEAEQLRAHASGATPTPPEAPALGAASERPPTQLLPEGAVSPDDEAAALAEHLATAHDTPLGLGAGTAAPDLPGYAGSRDEALATLTTRDLDTLLETAYGHDNAIANAMIKYPDPTDLADAALDRITTDRGLVARLSQVSPDLARRVAFLPDTNPVGAVRGLRAGTLGLLPGGGGLPSAALTRALVGAGGGGALGAVGGAAGGALAGDRGGDLLNDAAKGAAVGIGAGAAGSAAYPKLLQATTAGLAAVANKADSSAFTGEGLLSAHEAGIAAMQASKGAKGARLADLPGALDGFWRAQVTRTAKNWAQDAGNLAVLVKEFAPEFGANGAAVDATRVQLRTNLNNPDKVARYGDLGTRLDSMGLDGLIDQGKGLADLLGVSQITEATGRGTQLSAGQRIGAGAGIGLASGLRKVNPISPAVGAVTGYFAPYLDAFFGTLNHLQHDAPRVALLDSALARDMPELADQFLTTLNGRGISTGTLATRGGQFTPLEVTQIAGPVAGREWATLSEGLVRDHAERIAGIFGDFRDKGAAASLGDKAIAATSKVLPFSSWALRYAPTLAELAARHPVLTTGIAGGLAADAVRAQQEGRKGYTVGTVPISTETPVVGGLARARLGGQQGTVRADPLGWIGGPVGGDLLAGPEPLPVDATGYQKIKAGLGTIGLSPHPAIQSLAYVTGQDYQGPSALSRTAGLEGLADAVPVVARGVLRGTGHGDLAGLVPDVGIPSGRALLDTGRQLLSPVTGAGVSQSDPVTRRYAELVLTVTGKPLQDAANTGYLATIGSTDNPLWEQATLEAQVTAAAGNAVGLVSPVTTTGQTREATAAQQAPKLPYSEYQIGQAPAPLQGAMRAANAAIVNNNPASATYRDISGKDRTALLMAEWERQNGGYKHLAPNLYNERRTAYQQSIGGR